MSLKNKKLPITKTSILVVRKRIYFVIKSHGLLKIKICALKWILFHCSIKFIALTSQNLINQRMLFHASLTSNDPQNRDKRKLFEQSFRTSSLICLEDQEKNRA